MTVTVEEAQDVASEIDYLLDEASGVHRHYNLSFAND